LRYGLSHYPKLVIAVVRKNSKWNSLNNEAAPLGVFVLSKQLLCCVTAY
jgi:hypothetical protein